MHHGNREIKQHTLEKAVGVIAQRTGSPEIKNLACHGAGRLLMTQASVCVCGPGPRVSHLSAGENPTSSCLLPMSSRSTAGYINPGECGDLHKCKASLC